jgi:hypothetical protein
LYLHARTHVNMNAAMMARAQLGLWSAAAPGNPA